MMHDFFNILPESEEILSQNCSREYIQVVFLLLHMRTSQYVRVCQIL